MTWAPAHTSIRNAQLQAFRQTVAPPTIAFEGGPVLPADSRLRHCRYGKPADRLCATPAYTATVPGIWNYLGPVYNHFGHIMAEMIHRIIPSRRLFQHDHWIALSRIGRKSAGFSDLPASYKEILSFLEVDPERLRVQTQDCIVEQLNIAEQGSQLGFAAEAGYLDEISAFTQSRLDARFGRAHRNGRLYVSRSQLPRGGHLLGESYFEQVLQEKGFTIFRPENYPLPVQLDAYRRADVLVFAEGSACHGLELLGADLNRVYLLVRRQGTMNNFLTVLKPRARSFAANTDAVYVGTAALHKSEGRRLTEWGESFIPFDGLVGFLETHDLAPSAAFDKAAYHAAALREFDAYVAYHVQSGSLVVEGTELDRMRDLLASYASFDIAPG